MVRARTKSTAADGAQAGLRASTSHIAPDTILGKRESLIQERRSELGRIFTSHESLIREQFMLENYGLMLFYDPDVAKEDHTNEFLQFKNRHDLMRFMPDAGPSRATRRAQTDLISELAQAHDIGNSVSASTSAPVPTKAKIGGVKLSAPTAKRTALMKGKRKQMGDDRSTGGVNGVHASAKARGKRKAVDDGPEIASTSEADHSIESVSSRRIVSMIRQRLRSTSDASKRRSLRRSHSVLTDDTSSTHPSVPLSDRSLRKSTRDATARIQHAVQPRKKRRLLDKEDDMQRHLRISLPSSPTKLSSASASLSAAKLRPTASGKSLPGKTLPSTASSSKPMIKRIKLIVRPPKRMYSSPRQRPMPASFGYSLPSLLSSYVEVDGKNYAPTELEAAARRDARILNKLDELKQKGRYPGQDKLGGDASSKYRQSDVWANVVSEVIVARQSLSRHRFGAGGVVASSIHSKLHAHWELVRKDMEREQQLEERRLRSLAKSILKLVQAEWKKAVYHVRQEERMRMEQEEARRGRMHLESILDQSGAILERQQMELVRSEEASVGSDEEEEEEDTDVEESDEDGKGEESEVPTEVDEDEGSVSARASLGPKGGRHVEFEVPFNDVGANASEMSIDTSTRSASARTSEAGEFVVEDEGMRSVDGGEGHVDIQDEALAEREVSLDHDQDSEETPAFEANVSSSPSKASLESMSFMEDVRINSDEDELLHPDSIGVRTMGMSGVNGFDHEEIVGHDEPVAEESLDSAAGLAKRSSVTGKAVVEPEFKKDVSHLADAAPIAVKADLAAEAKLPNGHAEHVSHVNGADATVDGDVSGGVLEEPSPEAKVSSPEQINGGEEASPALTPDIANAKEVEPEHPPDHAGENQEAVNDAEGEDDEDERASESELESDWEPPPELHPFAVAHVKWEQGSKILPPLLLRGTLRPYQQSGLEWLASLHNNETNGILADEMGLGKTIQTIALLAHLACDRGIWGPHLIIVPTSVLLNWEMEFKKFLPGFKLLSYHGTTKRRKELRRGWNDKYAFNVCITSYTLASRDQHIFKRKAWYYMVLDEAHMIKNFKSQRWNILLMFRSCRRLLLTGTPLQNNLTELWALLRFLMSGPHFANQKEFSEWFGIPLEKAIELGNLQDQEVQLQVTKLHEMLRPFILRRMKKDVEKELPKKYEHLVLCRLSKRQRFLYDEFMSRRQTREDLQSGVYQKIANILMQLRKVCNHPDLFEVRPIVTSFAMEKSAIADFEIKELLVRRRMLQDEDERFERVNLDAVGLQFTQLCNTSAIAAQSVRTLEEVLAAELISSSPGEPPPPKDLRTIEGYRKYNAYQHRLEKYLRHQHMVYLNRLRCSRHIPLSLEAINSVRRMYNPLTTACEVEFLSECRPANHLVKPYLQRAVEMSDVIEKFAFATPTVVARDMPELALREVPTDVIESLPLDFDSVLHKPAVKLQIAFPDVSLLQYDCGKLQELDRLLRERKSGGHRVLIFTQMTRILDILEVFLNFHGYLYLRLDGATKIEDRQYVTERFNADPRVFAFIASSRSGGVGINLTGADTVIFYDSDFNPQMDKQCEDRAHRIGQIRDVHIYRFISQYTVEEAMLRKANQKRSLDDIVIQQGDFDWKNFFRPSDVGGGEEAPGPALGPALSLKSSALQKALVEFEDFEDVEAAKVAAREEAELQGEDRAEFGEGDGDGEGEGEAVAAGPETPTVSASVSFAGEVGAATPAEEEPEAEEDGGAVEAEEEEEGGTTVEYMIKFVRSDPEYFREWKLP